MAISLDEIYKNIQDMGYITTTSRHAPVPSFYKLSDGTILSLITHINHLVQNPINPNDASANLTTPQVLAFVPQNKRDPSGKQAGKNASMTIINEDVDYETLNENFNVYDLSNGTVLSIKTVLGQVQKTDLHTDMGEPIYTINSQPVIKVKNAKRPA